MRKRLLSEQKLTFEKAVELVMIVEQIDTDVDEMKTKRPTSNDVHRLNGYRTRVSSSNQSQKSQSYKGTTVCPHCTYKHQYGRCKAFNTFCNVCYQKGKGKVLKQYRTRWNTTVLHFLTHN